MDTKGRAERRINAVFLKPDDIQVFPFLRVQVPAAVRRKPARVRASLIAVSAVCRNSVKFIIRPILRAIGRVPCRCEACSSLPRYLSSITRQVSAAPRRAGGVAGINTHQRAIAVNAHCSSRAFNPCIIEFPEIALADGGLFFFIAFYDEAASAAARATVN